MSLPELIHRLSGDFPEQLAETWGRVADLRADFADGGGRIRKQLLRVLYPHDGLVIDKAHPRLFLNSSLR